jgi:hypothetical protein
VVGQLLLKRGPGSRIAVATEAVGGPAVGVVSRSDVVALLSKHPSLMPASPSAEEVTHVSLEQSLLPKAAVTFLRAAGALADEMGVSLYVVGGLPRDVLLNRANDDIDLVVSGGEASKFAKRLHEHSGDPAVPVLEHEAFHTAVVTLRDGSKIDIATARLEYYPLVAALPVVEVRAVWRLHPQADSVAGGGVQPQDGSRSPRLHHQRLGHAAEPPPLWERH